MQSIDMTCIKTLRVLAAEEVQKANSGHPGFPLGTAPLMYTIWDRFMNYNPEDPNWFNRDRFVLSPGHGSALLYAQLHLAGFGLTLEDLKQFRQWGSKTPGHPEYGVTAGVDCSTGPLGHGFAMGVGFALAEAILAARYNKEDAKIVDHYTYGIVSDGDLMEGVASEAASLAGTLGLGKLIYLYDDNKISIEGDTSTSFAEDVEGRFKAYGWQVLRVADSENIDAITAAIKDAQADAAHPSLIIVRTHIGFGSPRQDQALAHGEPLGEDGVKALKDTLEWPQEPSFYEPAEVSEYWNAKLGPCAAKDGAWKAALRNYEAKYPELAAEFKARLSGDYSVDLAELTALFEGKNKLATRAASGEILQKLAELLPGLTGGSADLGPSNKTVLKKFAYYSKEERGGRNIHFGVREHAMGAIVNGLALHGGFIPYGATFLVFADFVRPALRMAALMKIGSIFVFTHDSVAVGEDGPTHQPVEQLMSLRVIPNLTVFRPADAFETAAAWKYAVERKDGPTAICLSRQNLPMLQEYAGIISAGARRGGYVLAKKSAVLPEKVASHFAAATKEDVADAELKENDKAEKGKLSDLLEQAKNKMVEVATRAEARARQLATPNVTLIATGSEVSVALKAMEKLAPKGMNVKVVSMPSWELFEAQDDEYKASVVSSDDYCFSIEAGITLGWARYTGSEKHCLGINTFGASAPGEVVLEKYGITADKLVALVEANVHTLKYNKVGAE